MFRVNVNKIYGKMAEKNLTRNELAAKLGISVVTLRSYFEEPGRMPYRIMDLMAEILCDTLTEARDIFFAENLRKHKN